MPARTAPNRGRGRGTRHRRGGRNWLLTASKWAVLALALAAIGVGAYLVVLDREITHRFEGRRWSLPARVYAAPLAIYPGLAIAPDELVGELRRLGYRNAHTRDRNAHTRDREARTRDELGIGRYLVSGSRVRATLRPFRFADAERPALPIDVRFKGGRVASVVGTSGPMRYARLEPPVIGSFFASHGEDRLVVAPEETPPLLVETLKAVEDRNFDTHLGFDIKGMLRALWANVRAGGIEQGGSTLTQQLVRSYYLDNRPTIARKLREIAFAVILEARFEKPDLMNAYVNEIFLGQDGARAIHGFGLGSYFYFNKPLLELDAQEIALLVAVINGPSYYNPFRHPERAKRRRNLVLATMRDVALVDPRAYQRAVRQPLALAQSREGGRYYPAFMDLVRLELATDYDRDTLSAHGLAIHTTLDPRLQQAAETAAKTTLSTIERAREIPAGTLQVAIVLRSSQTGDIHAAVGGRQPGRQGFNRTLNAKRPIGSVIKPLVYLAALESGRYDLATPVEDRPLVLPEFDDYAPTNHNRQFHGIVPLVRALGDSLNVASVRVGIDVGIGEIAERLGDITGRYPRAYPSLLLGAYDASPFEVSEIYAVFASGGFRTPAKAVTAVVDAYGATIKRYPIDVEQAANPEDIAMLTRALQITMEYGTGRYSPLADSGVAGKTGTSDDYRDSWFAGYDANSLAVVWVGRDDNRPHGLSGSRGALRVWNSLMAGQDIVPALAAKASTISIDYATGLRAMPRCGGTVSIPVPAEAALRWKPGCEPP